MLAYFHDYQIENYDWFFRIDDDTVVQWNNLNEFLRGLHLQQNCNHLIIICKLVFNFTSDISERGRNCRE